MGFRPQAVGPPGFFKTALRGVWGELFMEFRTSEKHQCSAGYEGSSVALKDIPETAV